jgi:hypothetical protein
MLVLFDVSLEILLLILIALSGGRVSGARARA